LKAMAEADSREEDSFEDEEEEKQDVRPQKGGNNKVCETILEGSYEEVSLEEISNSSFSGAYGSNVDNSQSAAENPRRSQ
jgi:hypothetical protein